MLPARDRIMREHPAVSVRVMELDDATVDEAVRAGRVEIALVERETGTPPARSGLGSTHVLDDRYRVAVPTAWPVPTTLRDLGGRPWIEGPAGSVAAAVLDRHRRSTGLPFLGAHSSLEYPAVLDLVAAGLGAALLPDLATRNHPSTQVRIVELPALGGRAIHAIHLRQRVELRVISTFLAALRRAADELRGRPPA